MLRPPPDRRRVGRHFQAWACRSEARKWGYGSPVRARSREERLSDPDCRGTQPNQNCHTERGRLWERHAPQPSAAAGASCNKLEGRWEVLPLRAQRRAESRWGRGRQPEQRIATQVGTVWEERNRVR